MYSEIVFIVFLEIYSIRLILSKPDVKIQFKYPVYYVILHFFEKLVIKIINIGGVCNSTVVAIQPGLVQMFFSWKMAPLYEWPPLDFVFKYKWSQKGVLKCCLNITSQLPSYLTF